MRSRVILCYEDIFPGQKCPEDRFALVENLPQMILIGEFAKINLHLRPPTESFIRTDFDFQKNWIEHFVLNSKRRNFYFTQLGSFKENLGKTGDSTIIFNRSATLLGITEILRRGKNTTLDEAFKYDEEILADENSDIWENVFKYYLCLNSELWGGKVIASSDESSHDKLKNFFAYQGYVNELELPHEPILIFYRHLKFIKYLKEDPSTQLKYPALGQQLSLFLQSQGFSTQSFLHRIVHLFYHLSQKWASDRNRAYYVLIEDGDQEKIRTHEFLSKREAPTYSNGDHDFFAIKQGPLFKIKDYGYIVLDLEILVGKLYDLFFNDFFFDHLRDKDVIGKNPGESIKAWGSINGYFFETYAAKLIGDSFPHWTIPKPLLLDDLKVGKEQEEFADFYVRHFHKVMIGQMKASRVNAVKYSQSSDQIFDLDKTKDELFKRFGLFQLVNSIKSLLTLAHSFDPDLLNIDQKIRVFPTLLIQDKFIQSQMMPAIFQEKFNEEINKIDLPKQLDIRPLTIFHISDWEKMKSSLRDSKINLWDLMEENFTHKPIPRPFFYVLQNHKVVFDPHEILQEMVQFLDLK